MSNYRDSGSAYCSQHMLETDVTSDENADLNRVAVPLCSSASSLHSTAQLSESISCTPHLGSVSSSGFHTDQLLPTATNTFPDKETSFPAGVVHENACSGELGSIKPQTSSQKRKACHSILKKLDLDGVGDLNPRKLKLYNTLQTNDSALHKLRKTYRTKELKEICRLVGSPLIQSLSASLNAETFRFLPSVVRNRPKGRQWSCKEKVLCLSTLKRNPKSYTFLQSLFSLPSKQTLQSILNTVCFQTGINTHVFNILREKIQTMPDKDHVCCLMFDEMSIRENLCFNQKLGCIEGFEDLGSQGRTSNIANRALVFMLRGLCQKWKQPVAYYLTHRSTSGEMLVHFLKEVLDACQNSGLVVVATVCNMGANNVKALKLLGVSAKQPFFTFHSQKIAAVFDPSHLLKYTRDLFRTHDVMNVGHEVVVNGERLPGIAKWEDLLKIYESDKKNLIRMLENVTDSHLHPDAQTARNVSFAAQVMCRKAAALINSKVMIGALDRRALATAMFVKEVDDLFDSFNGVAHHREQWKVLRCCLSSTSEHLQYWRNAISKVKNWTFLNKKSERILPPPAQTGWLITIGAVQHVWRRVRKEKKFKYLETRNLNQDALENAFGAIRLHCGANNNPSVGQFVGALKTVILNDCTYKGLYGTACEDDGATLLDNLHSLLKPSRAFSPSPLTSHDKVTTDSVPYIVHVVKEAQLGARATVHASDTTVFSVAHVSGIIAMQLLHDGSCDACKACLISEVPSSTDVYIGFRAYSSTVQSVICPTEKLVSTVCSAVTVLESVMSEVGHFKSVELHVANAIRTSIDFEWIRLTGCSLHYQGLEEGIVTGVTRILIPWWCKWKNQSLRTQVRTGP